MIFAKTIDLVLSGRKTQTLRLACESDFLYDDGEIRKVSSTLTRRPRWVVGSTYAVQPERCHFARGRIRCTYLNEILDPIAMAKNAEFVRAEGFDTCEEFLRIWHELHPRKPVQRCWAIGFKLIERGGKPIGGGD